MHGSRGPTHAPRTVLITGGAGFIGLHLSAAHAAQGDQVWILDHLGKQEGRIDEELRALLTRPNVRHVACDLTAPLTLEISGRIDLVYHLAALNGTRLFYEIPYALARANLLMTLHLLDWLAEHPAGRLVYASTSEVYAGAEQLGVLRVPTDETAPVVFPQPTAVRFSYGTSKFMGEFLCLQFGQRYHVQTTVIRYHNIYGPRMGTRHVIPELLQRLAAGERPLRLYGADHTRAFCYVDDAVESTMRVGACAGAVGGIVHIGNPRAEVRIRELATLLMARLGLEVPIEEHPAPEASIRRRCPDTTALRRLTGFEPSTTLVDGLDRTIAWYRTAGGLRELADPAASPTGR